ncbi:DUF302 domain-containing protein [Aquimarina aggregata]|uniref:DUF302 domain-containing protein n=1 Tax=Aquimarina aggregata TaxID=1642818 RepID=UPI002490705C|nr:DUF302 domain-containing protein [Aquimarina aggregata]
MKAIIIVLAFLMICTSCKDDDDMSPGTNPPEVLGMSFTQSSIVFDESYTALKSSIDANNNINIIAEVNHTMNATSVGLTLNPTRIVFFGNPALGTPLMQRNQLAGLDLPQKILVYENNLNEVYLGFNNTAYLSARHGLDNVTTLPTIEGALTNLSTGATMGELMAPQNSMPDQGEGIVTKTSNKTFEDTYASLQMAIDANPNLRIIAEVNHEMNAMGAGMDLNPTRLIIFGNPNLGTPLMQNTQTTALDLPQKMLVWQDDADVVHVSYNDPAYLVKRHGITENENILSTITMALDNLSNVAIMN